MAESDVDKRVSSCSLNVQSAILVEHESNGHVHMPIPASITATDRNVDCSSSVLALE